MNRLPALDGLRGLAVSLVVLSHVFLFDSLWIGVDIFFVLSGFLITRILLAESHQNRFWQRFYVRRLARIVPAYLLLLLMVVVFFELRPRRAWALLILPAANIALYKYPSIYACGIGTLWSLSVEEHFYLVWPWMVRRFRENTLVTALLVLFLLESPLRLFAQAHGATWDITYSLTPFRLDGLAAGALLAFALQRQGIRQTFLRLANPLLFCALAVLLACAPFLSVTQHVTFHNALLFPLLAVVFGVCLAYVLLLPDSRFAGMLSVEPLLFLGRISYGLYLFHTLIGYALMKYLPAGLRSRSPLGFGVLWIAVALLVSWASFRFLESPIMRQGRRWLKGIDEQSVIAAT